MAEAPVRGLLAVGLLLAASAACTEEDAPLPEDGDAAAAAITLRVRATGFTGTPEDIFRPFSERSGVAVSVEEVAPGDLLAWGDGSGDARAPDLLLVRDAVLLREAAERGLLVGTSARRLETSIAPELRDEDGAWLGVGQWAVVVAYACGRVDAANVDRYTALADSAWAGRLALPDEGALSALLASRVGEFGDEAAAAWLEAVRANAVEAPPEGVASLLRSGATDATLAATDRLAADLGPWALPEARGGEEVCVAFPDQGGPGAHVRLAAAGVPARAARREGGRRLLDFLASEEGQTQLARLVHLYPVRPNVPWPPRFLAWGDFMADTLHPAGLAELDARASRLMAGPPPVPADSARGAGV
ncbi:MAG: ABC transporter substrate-binding protein [Gemmatimonadetes bacterium]|nr:ABC transporter substrate-binding protein [Gemmatimonadota bacterium]